MNFRHALVLALATALLCFMLFMGAETAQQQAIRSNVKDVYVDGEQIGTVHLFPLTRSGGLRIYFDPKDRNLSVIQELGLSWWQAIDRPGMSGYPRMDVEPAGTDDDPAYYTHEERHDKSLRPLIFRDNKWWMQDFPDPENGADFETWFVRRRNRTVERLILIEWGFDAQNSQITNYKHPKFIETSRYNLPDFLSQNGFGDGWVEQ
jgi:hypothetical protein